MSRELAQVRCQHKLVKGGRVGQLCGASPYCNNLCVTHYNAACRKEKKREDAERKIDLTFFRLNGMSREEHKRLQEEKEFIEKNGISREEMQKRKDLNFMKEQEEVDKKEKAKKRFKKEEELKKIRADPDYQVREIEKYIKKHLPIIFDEDFLTTLAHLHISNLSPDNIVTHDGRSFCIGLIEIIKSPGKDEGYDFDNT